MRDLGLFGGPERVEPPVPIALLFWRQFVRAIGEFLISLWLDGGFPIDAKRHLTHWALTELLPAPPVNLTSLVRRRIAHATPYFLLSEMLAASIHSQDYPALNQALVCVRESLEFTEVEYARLIGEIVHVHSAADAGADSISDR